MEERMISVEKCEKIGKGKYRICFENGVVCQLYRSEVLAYAITENACIAEADYQQIMTEILGKRAKKRALHLLEQMDRTEAQLREKLAMGLYPRECIEAAVSYVKKYHYLNDYRYACNFIRLSQNKMSRQMLCQKLIQKGVKISEIERALEEEFQSDELLQIRSLLEKKKFRGAETGEKEFVRIYQYILRRGFSSNDVMKAMKTFDVEM